MGFQAGSCGNSDPVGQLYRITFNRKVNLVYRTMQKQVANDTTYNENPVVKPAGECDSKVNDINHPRRQVFRRVNHC
jgi:hypothetical protein